MHAGFSSYAVGWAVGAEARPDLRLSAAGVVALAAQLGYRRVQLADNVPLHRLASTERAALRRQADTAGVSLEVGARGLTPENLEHYVGYAKEFASPLVRFVIDAPGHEPNPDAVIRLLRAHVDLLARSATVLAIENHDRFDSATLAHILASVDSPWVGLCLDTANSLGAGEDVRTVVHALARHVVNVHLKDVRARRVSYLQGFTIEGTPLGAGQVPLAWVLHELQPHGRCQSATLEHWVPPEPTLEATIQKEREWCDLSTLTMRRLFPASFSTGSRSAAS